MDFELIFEGIISFVAAILIIIAKWIVFLKSGEKGWKSIIPVYNDFTLFKIAGRKKWFWWVLFYPVFIIIKIAVLFDIAKKFGKKNGFALGLVYFPVIFYPIIAFGKAKYDNTKKMKWTLFWEIIIGVLGVISLLVGTFIYILYHPGQNENLDELRLKVQTPLMKMLSDYLIDGRANNRFGLINEHNYFENDEDMISWEEFKPYINQLHRGDILFTDGARYISSIVIPGTRKHALIYLGDGEIIDATSKGVTTGVLQDLDNLSRGSLLKEIIAFRPNLTDNQKEQFIQFALKQLGKPYDFDYDKEDKDAYYCSELVADGLASVGLNISYESKSIGKMVVSPEDAVKYIQEVGLTNGEYENIFWLAKELKGGPNNWESYLVDKNGLGK